MNKKNNVSKNFWELPELIEINRLPMAAELMTFDTAENALTALFYGVKSNLCNNYIVT